MQTVPPTPNSASGFNIKDMMATSPSNAALRTQAQGQNMISTSTMYVYTGSSSKQHTFYPNQLQQMLPALPEQMNDDTDRQDKLKTAQFSRLDEFNTQQPIQGRQQNLIMEVENYQDSCEEDVQGEEEGLRDDITSEGDIQPQQSTVSQGNFDHYLIKHSSKDMNFEAYLKHQSSIEQESQRQILLQNYDKTDASSLTAFQSFEILGQQPEH